jgi:hypothetical protein
MRKSESGYGRGVRTFGDFDSLHGFVVYEAGAFLDEFVALDAEIQDICTLHA